METPELRGNVLRATLTGQPFEVMITGEKKDEYRSPGQWIKSRLTKNDYDQVLFVNGYGARRPWLLCEFHGWDEAAQRQRHTFSNGLVVAVAPGDYIIHLGKVLATGNLLLPAWDARERLLALPREHTPAETKCLRRLEARLIEAGVLTIGGAF